MGEIALLPLVVRWLHILSATVVVGGGVFLWLVVPRALTRADLSTGDDRSAVQDALLRLWGPLFHTCILLFLVSGFYNYLLITRFEHTEQPVYHMLFGVKFLLALVVFAVGVALTSRHDWSARIHANARFWVGLLTVVAIAVVLISGTMRALPKAPATPTAPITVETSPAAAE